MERRSFQIHVSGLQVGMFVVELDRPWLETPFLLQGFELQNMADIEEVQKYCEYVYVEERRAAPRTAPGPVERVAARAKPRKRLLQKTTPVPDLGRARATRTATQTVTRSVMDDVRLGKAIDVRKAEATVSECVENIISDPAAMLWMSRLREHDERITQHSMNTMILSITVARHMGFEEEDLHNIGLCAMLHDVGKMKLPAMLLLARQRTPEQEKEYRRHTVYGQRILFSYKDLYPGCATVAISHHEHVDGTGYPNGYRTEKLTPFTKLIAVCNAYDEYTIDGVDGTPLSSLAAMKRLSEYSGRYFEEEYVRGFIECLGLYPSGSVVELVDGSIGLVVSQNFKARRLPNILRVRGPDKAPCAERILNLDQMQREGRGRDSLVKDVLPNGSHGVRLEDYIKKGLRLD
ncbi:MAG: DUF3391 domain-containing protein [Halieaceae bacterium]|jgi:HD-GYP domain-containing protein (c-di-GMP phosphodiesterase class II)|nr:DUF3391 domain-containing protein [Halieaceae bacterium]